jgi:NAD(P)-dependent dehydrogenase (short-subunit alcohol dehydrogenase family)
VCAFFGWKKPAPRGLLRNNCSPVTRETHRALLFPLSQFGSLTLRTPSEFLCDTSGFFFTLAARMKCFDLTGEVAVVIGATGELGGAIAEGLAQAGATIAVLGRNHGKGAARVKKIHDAGGRGDFFSADAVKRESLTAAREAIEKQLGAVSILVNAAGGNDPKVTVTAERSFESIQLADWQANFDLNLVGGVLLPCQEFGPAMVARGRGSIINIASVSAHLPLSRVVAYSSAKAAVLNLTQFLAREWAPKNVRVNSITPGFFPAEQNRKLLFNDDGSPTARTKSILGHTPMGRFGVAEELVGAAVFLASSKASSFVTGTDIRVDGGFLSQTI